MTPKEVLDILNSIEPVLWGLLFKAALACLIVYMAKQVIENIGHYLLFRFNKRLGINVKVRLNGVEGIIVEYNVNWIIIRTNRNSKIVIPIKRWKFQQWEIIENSSNVEPKAKNP